MYRILLVDHEPASLWALSNFLRLSGYEVWQASDAEQALAVCDYAPPQFIVADWESPSGTGTELCRRVRTRALAGYVYFILRTATHDPNELIDALQAGVDDFIAQSVVHGELLARLRAGARMLEYERRLATLATSDSLTGVGTAAACRAALAAAIAGASRHHAKACVYADADYFGRINYLHGHPMGDAAIHALADRLTSAAGAASEVFRLEGDRFAVLLANADEARGVPQQHQRGDPAEFWRGAAERTDDGRRGDGRSRAGARRRQAIGPKPRRGGQRRAGHRRRSGARRDGGRPAAQRRGARRDDVAHRRL